MRAIVSTGQQNASIAAGGLLSSRDIGLPTIGNSALRLSVGQVEGKPSDAYVDMFSTSKNVVWYNVLQAF